MRSRGLSKSRIMAGIQCSKRLYLETYHRELAEESADKEALFKVGHQVGALARTLWRRFFRARQCWIVVIECAAWVRKLVFF